MLAVQPGAYVELRMRVGGRMGLQEMANVNLCTCGEIITDYHNHIWLWRDIDFRPALFFMHVSKPIPSWLALLNWCPLCDRTWFQDIWAKGKISL